MDTYTTARKVTLSRMFSVFSVPRLKRCTDKGKAFAPEGAGIQEMKQYVFHCKNGGKSTKVSNPLRYDSAYSPLLLFLH